MSMYKLIAVDMDGTLLNDNKEITKPTLFAIHELIKKGYIFCISTGRPYYGVKPYCDLINGDIPLIIYNGAVVRFSQSQKEVFSCNLSCKQSSDILKLMIIRLNTLVFRKWSQLLLIKIQLFLMEI